MKVLSRLVTTKSVARRARQIVHTALLAPDGVSMLEVSRYEAARRENAYTTTLLYWNIVTFYIRSIQYRPQQTRTKGAQTTLSKIIRKRAISPGQR